DRREEGLIDLVLVLGKGTRKVASEELVECQSQGNVVFVGRYRADDDDPSPLLVQPLHGLRQAVLSSGNAATPRGFRCVDQLTVFAEIPRPRSCQHHRLHFRMLFDVCAYRLVARGASDVPAVAHAQEWGAPVQRCECGFQAALEEQVLEGRAPGEQVTVTPQKGAGGTVR